MTITDSIPTDVPDWIDLDKLVPPTLREESQRIASELLPLMPRIAEISEDARKLHREFDALSLGVSIDDFWMHVEAWSGMREFRELLQLAAGLFVEADDESSVVAPEEVTRLKTKYVALLVGDRADEPGDVEGSGS